MTPELTEQTAIGLDGNALPFETAWCQPPANAAGLISFSRWTGQAAMPRSETARVGPDRHVLGLGLRLMSARIFENSRKIHEGRIRRGMMRLTPAGTSLRADFEGVYDVLHMHIPAALLDECLEGGRKKNSGLSCGQFTIDPVVDRLAQMLVQSTNLGDAFGPSYVDGIGIAILARVLGRESWETPASPSRVASLPTWRLKRAVDFITEHLAEPIGLAEIAASTGVTRMHFAAQFRARMGMPPHEYLLRRRVERAQELLATTSMPLVEVALEVGFKGQAHFTTVFARIAGQTPGTSRRNARQAPTRHQVSARKVSVSRAERSATV